jgi:hypothetical protein
MSAQSIDPVDKLPSIVNASTQEEDYFFTSLGLEDDSGSDDGAEGGQTRNEAAGTNKSSDLLQPRNREDRMRAAYEESKRLYKAEHGYTESGVRSICSAVSKYLEKLIHMYAISVVHRI